VVVVVVVVVVVGVVIVIVIAIVVKASLGGNVLATESAKIVPRKVCLQSQTQTRTTTLTTMGESNRGGHILITETNEQL
jgi:hypothetical protein